MTMMNSPQDSAVMRAAIGVLTLEQAAAQLPVPPNVSVLAIKRLVARGAIPAASNATVPMAGISTEAMNSFLVNGSANRDLRQNNGAPPETLLPIFLGKDGAWFDLTFVAHILQAFRRGLLNMLDAQMPPSYAELQAAARLYSPKWGNAANATGDVSVGAVMTPEMKALISRPIDTSFMVNAKGISQAKNFLNAGEIFLASQLQNYADGALSQRENAQGFSLGAEPLASGLRSSLAALYSSRDLYAEIVGQAVAAMQSSVGNMAAVLTMPPLKAGGSSRNFSMYIPAATILKEAGTNVPRIVSLAF